MEPKKEPETLSEMIEDTRPIYSGHPAEASSGDDKSGKVGDEEAKDKTKVAGDKEEEGKSSKEEEKKEKPAGEEEKKTGDEEEKKTFTFKYESHEEAERGYLEAERRMTEAAQEAKQERDRANELQRQLNEALLKPGKTEEEKKEIKEAIKSADIFANALDQIAKIPGDDDDYQVQAGEIWGKAYEQMNSLSEQKIQAAIDERFEEQKKLASQKTQDEIIVEKCEKIAVNGGLDMTPGTDDYELFWDLAVSAKGETYKEQAEYVVDRILRLRKPVADKKKAEEVAKKNEALERGGERPSKESEQKEEAPVSLYSAFEQSQRRV